MCIIGSGKMAVLKQIVNDWYVYKNENEKIEKQSKKCDKDWKIVVGSRWSLAVL